MFLDLNVMFWGLNMFLDLNVMYQTNGQSGGRISYLDDDDSGLEAASHDPSEEMKQPMHLEEDEADVVNDIDFELKSGCMSRIGTNEAQMAAEAAKFHTKMLRVSEFQTGYDVNRDVSDMPGLACNTTTGRAMITNNNNFYNHRRPSTAEEDFKITNKNKKFAIMDCPFGGYVHPTIMTAKQWQEYRASEAGRGDLQDQDIVAVYKLEHLRAGIIPSDDDIEYYQVLIRRGRYLQFRGTRHGNIIKISKRFDTSFTLGGNDNSDHVAYRHLWRAYMGRDAWKHFKQGIIVAQKCDDKDHNHKYYGICAYVTNDEFVLHVNDRRWNQSEDKGGAPLHMANYKKESLNKFEFVGMCHNPVWYGDLPNTKECYEGVDAKGKVFMTGDVLDVQIVENGPHALWYCCGMVGSDNDDYDSRFDKNKYMWLDVQEWAKFKYDYNRRLEQFQALQNLVSSLAGGDNQVPQMKDFRLTDDGCYNVFSYLEMQQFHQIRFWYRYMLNKAVSETQKSRQRHVSNTFATRSQVARYLRGPKEQDAFDGEASLNYGIQTHLKYDEIAVQLQQYFEAHQHGMFCVVLYDVFWI